MNREFLTEDRVLVG